MTAKAKKRAAKKQSSASRAPQSTRSRDVSSDKRETYAEPEKIKSLRGKKIFSARSYKTPTTGVDNDKFSRLIAFVRASATAKVLIAFAIFMVLMYAPYVAKGGLQYDDWSVARLGKGCPGLVSSFKCYWPNYAHRPLATFYYATTTNLFHADAAGYIITAVTLWTAAVLTMFTVLKKRFGLGFAAVFLFIAAVPSLSSSIILSPAMQSVGTLSFLVWAVSFYLLDRSLDTGSRRQLWGSYALMLGSLLFYESSLPLFGLSIFWPYIVKPAPLTRVYAKTYAKQYVVPLFAIMVFLIMYQKLIITHLVANAAALSKFLILGSHANVIDFALRTFTTTSYIFTIGVSSFLLRAVVRLHLYSPITIINAVLILLPVAVGLWYARRSALRKKQTKSLPVIFLLPVIAGIMGMHYVALQAPTFVGYLNRGMVAAAIVVALLGAIIWQKLAYRNRWLAVLCALLVFAHSMTFLVQRNNFMDGRRVQDEIRADVLSRIQPYQDQPMFILAYVPTYLPHNFNNETVFSDEVLDWAHFLYLATNNPNVAGLSVSQARVKRGELVYKDGILRTIGGNAPLSQVYFYDYTHQTLVRVTSKEQLDHIFKNAPDALQPLPVDGQMRESIRSWLATY